MFNSFAKSFFFMMPFLTVSIVLFIVGFTSGQYLVLLGSALFLIIPLAVSYRVQQSIAAWGKVNDLKEAEKREFEDLKASGKQGTAKVLQLQETGRRIDFKPQVKIQLENSIPNYPNYQVQKVVALPVSVMPQVQPGSIIQVLVDPQQPNNEKRIGLLLK